MLARRCHISEIGQAHISYAFENAHTYIFSQTHIHIHRYTFVYSTRAAGVNIILNCRISCRCQSSQGCGENRALNDVSCFFAYKHTHIRLCTGLHVSQVPYNIKSNKQLEIFFGVFSAFLSCSRFVAVKVSSKCPKKILNVDLFKICDL